MDPYDKPQAVVNEIEHFIEWEVTFLERLVFSTLSILKQNNGEVEKAITNPIVRC